MATFSIAGTPYSSLAAAFAGVNSVPANGIYYCLKPYGIPPREGPLVYKEVDLEWPAVPGMSTRRFGGRFRMIYGELLIINTSEATVETAKNALMTAMTALSRFTVQVPGGTARTGCKLVANGAVPLDWEIFDTKFALLVPVLFRDLSGAA